MRTAALVVLLVLSVSGASAEGIWIGRGPISCLVPVDSISERQCEESVALKGHAGRCTMAAVKNGLDYTVTVSARGTYIPRLPLPAFSASPLVQVTGVMNGRCVVTGDVTWAKCTTWGNEMRGGGTCSFCTSKECYRGSGTITLTPKFSMRRAAR